MRADEIMILLHVLWQMRKASINLPKARVIKRISIACPADQPKEHVHETHRIIITHFEQ